MRRNKNGFVFAITQNICVAMPVEFSTEEAMGDSYLNCTGSSEEGHPYELQKSLRSA